MDKCPCGAGIVVDSVTPDLEWWVAQCFAGHYVLSYDLKSWRIYEAETV